MENRTELVAYVPVIHRGYINLFERHRGDIDTLWVMGDSLVRSLIARQEIRALSPEQVATMARSLGYFATVEVLNESGVCQVTNRRILMPDEEVSRKFAQQFLINDLVVFEQIFLRWNETNVTSSQFVKPDRLSSEFFDQRVMRQLDEEAEKSSDWWRHIGAAIVSNGEILMLAHNKHEPTEQTQYAVGDPRDVIESGTHNLLYGSIHAEQMLVAQAASDGISLRGTSLYINIFPCPMCTKLIAESGVCKCYFRSGSAWLNSDEVMRAFGIEIVQVVG